MTPVGPFELVLSTDAKNQTQAITSRLKKTFGFLTVNPNHPGLQSHPITQFDKIFGGKVFSSYVQNNTSQAYRILWIYGPKPKQITVVAIIPHY